MDGCMVECDGSSFKKSSTDIAYEKLYKSKWAKDEFMKKWNLYNSRYEHVRRLDRMTNMMFKCEYDGKGCTSHPSQLDNVVILDDDVCKMHMINGDTKHIYCILPLGVD